MALNIKNKEVERLAAEVAELAHETKTQAIRRALEERKERLQPPAKQKSLEELVDFFRREIWSHIKPEYRGKPVTKQEREEILGIGPNGYPE
jgi:antitoxin VapB